MDAMILAAGLGTRLRPLTDTCPKALVPVGGVPAIERVARRLIDAGAGRLVVNLHAFAPAIESYVRLRGGFGVEVAFSREEPAPLETGGGLLAARGCLRGDAPFFLHNVDVVTDLPLRDLYDAHVRARGASDGALATLAVMERPTSRRLLFDDRGLLGRVDDAKGVRTVVREAVGDVRELGFLGVHVISPALFPRISERGAFAITDVYLRLAREGERIVPFDAAGSLWIDVGRPESLAAASAEMASREAAASH